MAKLDMNTLRQAYDTRPPAEKVILGVLLATVIGWLHLTFAFDPLRADIAGLEARIAGAQSSIFDLELRQQRAEADNADDPNRAARERLEELIVEEAAARGQLEALTGSVVPPTSMNRLLTGVLDIDPGLRLVRVENLPSERIAGAEAIESSGQSVFRHGLVLELEGNYLSVLRYLVYLEGLSENFYWDALSIVPGEWPQSSVILELHTLSAEETFAGV